MLKISQKILRISQLKTLKTYFENNKYFQNSCMHPITTNSSIT